MSDSFRLSHSRTEAERAGNIEIHLSAEGEPVNFAAEELLRYLPRLLPGAELKIYLGSPNRAPATAGFPAREMPTEGTILVQGDEGRYSIMGGSPPAVLHAAYAFLESLGARWLKPGLQGEVIHPFVGPLPSLQIHSSPAFAQRGLTEGCLSWWPGAASFQEWLKETRQTVDWMGKQRMNRLFVHFNRLPPGDLSPLLPELERRGIDLELGGHCLPKLLPPGSREAEPELCRLWEGQRRPDGNFCTSHPRTPRLLAEGARHYAEQLPPARVYHLWPYDAKEFPWCRCPQCEGLSMEEQMWRAVSAAAEGIAAVRPDATVSGLLYHESLGAVAEAPVGVQILFGPRERCYLHPLEGDCPRNREYFQQLQAAVGQASQRLSVLEYYGDPILLGRPANRPALVGLDLAAYRAAGVPGISSLVFGALSWWLYPLQMYAYARGSWEPAAVVSAVQDYCRAAAGEVGGDLLDRYYRLEGEAAGTHLRFCGYGKDGSWATLPFPPGVPPEEAQAQLAEMKRGEAVLREAGGLLERTNGLHDGSEGLLVPALSAHRLEEAFHRAVIGELSRAIEGTDEGYRDAFATVVEAMEQAPAELQGVFGSHWMLPWLRRCIRDGRTASL